MSKEIIEKIEVIINRHSPMDNFKIKENCAKDIYKEVFEQTLSSQQDEMMTDLDKILSKFDTTNRPAHELFDEIVAWRKQILKQLK